MSKQSMSKEERLTRKLANVIRAFGIRTNDMHLVQMCDQAMDADDKDAVDIGGYLGDAYVDESPGAQPPEGPNRKRSR